MLKRLLLAALLALGLSPATAGTIYVDTGGATTNSGSSDGALQLSGVASTDSTTTITLTAGTDLSGVITTAGATQSSIYLTASTVANRKIYWISGTAGSGGATPTVTVDTAPACTAGACGAWVIGGRLLWTASAIEASLRGGDIIQFNNSPATATATYITFRTSGDSTNGNIVLKGKSGVMPTLNVTNTSAVISGNSQTDVTIQDIVLDQDGASGNCASASTGWVFNHVRIIDCGGVGISTNGSLIVTNSEISTAGGGDGINTTATVSNQIFGNYIHDCGGDGIDISSTAYAGGIANNVIDTNAGRGILLEGAPTARAHGLLVANNTIYLNGDSGLEVTDADSVVDLYNNIFQANGDAAGEYNVEWVAGTAELHGVHGYNDFFLGTGNANLLNLTANATEITTDPAMTSPTAGNFTITNTSPAYATAYPGVLLSTSSTTSYLSMGPVQVQGASGSTGAHGLIIGGP